MKTHVKKTIQLAENYTKCYLLTVMLQIKNYIDDLLSKGIYSFATQQYEQQNGSSEKAAQAAIRRLREKKELVTPYRGFHIIVPPEYRRLGCLPADQLTVLLMEYLQEDYYVGLLSAAQFYGAAHQSPQTFQVVVKKNRPIVRCGDVQLNFIAKKADLSQIPIQSFNTRRGSINVSSPEIILLDLIAYPNHSGGLGNIAVLIDELAESINPKALLRHAKKTPIRWIQRLGYLAELVDVHFLVEPLKQYINEAEPRNTPLSPSLPTDKAILNKDWRIIVNQNIEVDI